MLDERYLIETVGRHRVDEQPEATPFKTKLRLEFELRQWGRADLNEVVVSGSYAKGTAIRGPSLWPSDVDVDLFLSLRPQAPEPLLEYRRGLAWAMRKYEPVARNAAIRIYVENRRVDLVPGRKMGHDGDHAIWLSQKGTWTRTNVAEHIRFVRNSGSRDVILAAKIWRRRWALAFPSFCLELAVIEALAEHGSAPRHGSAPLGERFRRALEWMAKEMPYAVLRDPANQSNVVSDAMTEHEKWMVVNVASVAVWAKSWREVV